MWDTSNAQKNKFRLQRRGVFFERRVFPRWPWDIIKDPKYLETKHGNLLLLDGWWKIIRKPHYVGDMCMFLMWALVTGWNSGLPYIVVVFFYSMLFHRAIRDEHRCSLKYGTDWDKFCKIVPYKFIPYIY